jgi:hypothetical protein
MIINQLRSLIIIRNFMAKKKRMEGNSVGSSQEPNGTTITETADFYAPPIDDMHTMSLLMHNLNALDEEGMHPIDIKRLRFIRENCLYVMDKMMREILNFYTPEGE